MWHEGTANIVDVATLGPDFMGFIFYPHSPRYVGEAFDMPTLPPDIQKVGVFVNDSVPTMMELARNASLDYIQLHGYESVEKCELMKSAGYKIIKAFGIDETFDFKALQYYRDVVNYFLFDTKGKHYGGNATSFDWSLLKRYEEEAPYFLSGGLSPENVEGIVELNDKRLFAVD
ncbi:MAG: phosphoribosylanthranilate isomerase [Bacteroidia bacterium]|nr:phosphoribosylanthranilate isomerase [Bacteroidia bacterium]